MFVSTYGICGWKGKKMMTAASSNKWTQEIRVRGGGWDEDKLFNPYSYTF